MGNAGDAVVDVGVGSTKLLIAGSVAAVAIDLVGAASSMRAGLSLSSDPTSCRPLTSMVKCFSVCLITLYDPS